MVTKRTAPFHGTLGEFAGKSVKEVRDYIQHWYTIPTGKKVVITYSRRDPPYNLYMVELVRK